MTRKEQIEFIHKVFDQYSQSYYDYRKRGNHYLNLALYDSSLRCDGCGGYYTGGGHDLAILYSEDKDGYKAKANHIFVDRTNTLCIHGFRNHCGVGGAIDIILSDEELTTLVSNLQYGLDNKLWLPYSELRYYVPVDGYKQRQKIFDIFLKYGCSAPPEHFSKQTAMYVDITPQHVPLRGYYYFVIDRGVVYFTQYFSRIHDYEKVSIEELPALFTKLNNLVR